MRGVYCLLDRLTVDSNIRNPIEKSKYGMEALTNRIAHGLGNQGSESCATKRRACKDCSCGRAQEEGDGMPQTVVSVTDVDDVLVSSCGNCSKVSPVLLFVA